MNPRARIERREISAPGARLVVETQGEGDPLVLLHGFASDRRLWDLSWPALVQRRRVIRYDLRGFGESIQTRGTPFRHSRDLSAILDALALPRCDLIGVSMGGAIALNFALDNPQRVGRMVLVSPGMVAWEWSEPWRSLWQQIVAAARNGNLTQARELWWQHPLFATTRAVPAAAEILRRSIAAYCGAHWLQEDDEETAMPDIERLNLLIIPTLLLTGSMDLSDFRLIADVIETAATDVRRIDYVGAGHLLHLERPAAFLADTAAFLGMESV